MFLNKPKHVANKCFLNKPKHVANNFLKPKHVAKMFLKGRNMLIIMAFLKKRRKILLIIAFIERKKDFLIIALLNNRNLLLIKALLKRPKHVANNYLNLWFIKVLYRLYLILFYLFVHYSTTGMPCLKAITKTFHLNILHFLLWFSQVGTSDLLMTVTWQESERSQKPAWITSVLRFFSAYWPWFSLVTIHARCVKKVFLRICKIYPLNYHLSNSPHFSPTIRTMGKGPSKRAQMQKHNTPLRNKKEC